MGVNDAMKHREIGKNHNNPQHGRDPVKESSDNQEHDSLGPLEEPDFAGGDDIFGPGPRVARHNRADHRHRHKDNIPEAVAATVIDQQASEQKEIGIPVQDRIKKAAERRHAVAQSRYRAVRQIENSSDNDRQARPPEISKGEKVRPNQVDQQSDAGQNVGAHSVMGKGFDDPVKNILPALADFRRDHS